MTRRTSRKTTRRQGDVPGQSPRKVPTSQGQQFQKARGTLEHWDALLAEFGTPTQRAMTLSRRVAVSPCVVDAQIVQSTPEAAAFYGYARPEEMVGAWQSYLQHPADLRLSRAMAIRRHFGYDQMPVDYVIRIRQGGGHTFRRVMKHTIQLLLDGETYWVTVLEDTRAPLLADCGDILTQFPLPDSEAVRQYSGIMSVTDMLYRIHTLPAAVDLTSVVSRSIMSALQTSQPPWPLRVALLDLALGATATLSDGTCLHRCGQCGVVWISAQADPVKCPRQRHDSRGPKCGSRRWRQPREGSPHATNPPA